MSVSTLLITPFSDGKVEQAEKIFNKAVWSEYRDAIKRIVSNIPSATNLNAYHNDPSPYFYFLLVQFVATIYRLRCSLSNQERIVSNYTFDWTIITSGKYFGWILSGFYTTVQLSVVSITMAFLLGLIIAVMRMSQILPVRWFAFGYPGVSFVIPRF